ncbi:MAG: hypothetical protein M3Z07_03945 [Candidatus Eremiobacteraeota bacterium]|nr:hypothetical protein [Candidatus Eremiobacteraeota bacterium]
MTGASPKRCAIVIFREACREDVAAARAAGLLSAPAYRAVQPYLEGGDLSLLPPRLLDLDVGRLAQVPGEAAFYRNLGTSKVIAQTTVGIAGVETAAATMIREAFRHAPRAFALAPRDASQREFAADLDRAFPDMPASAVTIGERAHFARLGLYLGSFEETLDEPMLVLDGSTRGFLYAFLDAYQTAISSPEDLRAVADVRERLTAARSVNDIPRLELARRNLRGIATHIVPVARVAEFDFGVAAAQGAYNAAVRKDPEAATRWMDFAGAYAGLDADPVIRALRNRVKAAHSDDWREQNAAFTLLANAVLQTTAASH